MEMIKTSEEVHSMLVDLYPPSPLSCYQLSKRTGITEITCRRMLKNNCVDYREYQQELREVLNLPDLVIKDSYDYMWNQKVEMRNYLSHPDTIHVQVQQVLHGVRERLADMSKEGLVSLTGGDDANRI